MLGRNKLNVWVPLLLLSVVSCVCWALPVYENALPWLGVLSVTSATMLLGQHNDRWAISGVAACLIVGQFWFVQLVFLAVAWSMAGFAP